MVVCMSACLCTFTLIGMRGYTFTSLYFLGQILSVDFLPKVCKLFLEVETDINLVNLIPCQAHWVLTCSNDLQFSCFHKSCQWGFSKFPFFSGNTKDRYVSWYFLKVRKFWPARFKVSDGAHQFVWHHFWTSVKVLKALTGPKEENLFLT